MAAVSVEDKNQFKTFTNRIMDAVYEDEKATAANDLFSFLAARPQMFESSELRSQIKRIVLGFSRYEPHYQKVMGQSLYRVCSVLKKYEASTIPGCHIPDLGYEVVGSGSYGSVVRPALPNIRNNNLVNYPSNVTKVFENNNFYEKAFQNTSRMHNITGNNAYRANRYTRKYKLKNLPSSLARKLRRELPGISDDNNLHLVRMPDLGKDVKNIDKIRFLLRSLPFDIILGQFQKLVKQVAQLRAAGYVHLDIRDSNLMVHPTTGAMTIIDFDHLRKFSEFIYGVDYPYGFYSNTPECLLLDYAFDTVMDSNENDEDFVKENMDEEVLDEYIHYNFKYFRGAVEAHGFSSEDELSTEIINANMENIPLLRTAYHTDHPDKDQLIARYIIPMVDSYGLAMTLLQFMSRIYPEGITLDANGRTYTAKERAAIDEALYSCKELFRKMSSFTIASRLQIDDALELMDSIVETYNDQTKAINNNAKSELERMSFFAGNKTLVGNKSRRRRRHRRQRTYRKY